MPVTVKFSEKFYETFGHELTDELVNHLNYIDQTYRSEFRELNFARFDAKIEQRAIQLDAKIEQRTAELRGEMVAGFASCKADLIKWMFVFWAGTTVTVVGTMITLVKL